MDTNKQQYLQPFLASGSEHGQAGVFSQAQRFFLVQCLHSMCHALLLIGFIFYQFAQPLFLNSDVFVFVYLCLFVALSIDFLYFYFYDKIKSTYFWFGLFLLFDVVWMTVCLNSVQPVLSYALIFLYLLSIVSAGLMGGYKWAFAQGLWVSILFSWLLIINPLAGDQSLVLSFVLNNVAFLSVAGLSGFFGQNITFVSGLMQILSTNTYQLKDLNKCIVENINMGFFILDNKLSIISSNKIARRLLHLPDNSNIVSSVVIRKLGLKNYLHGQNVPYSKSVRHSAMALPLSSSSPSSPSPNKKAGLNNKEKALASTSRFEVECTHGLDKRILEVFVSSFGADIFDDSQWIIKGVSKQQLSPQDCKKYLVLFQDVTLKHKQECQDRDKEKLAGIGQMATGIAHEIQTPLSNIGGAIKLLLKNKKMIENQKTLNTISKEMHKVNHIVGEFLDYSIDEKSSIANLKTESLSVNTVLESLLDKVSSNKKWKHITHHFTLKSHGLTQISKEHLKKIFFNVIKNACEAMEKQPTGILEVESFDDNEWVVVRVKDTGCGISEQEMKHIFEPFYTKASSGPGLGLSIVKKLMTLYKGTISFQNRKRVKAENDNATHHPTHNDKNTVKSGVLCTLRFPMDVCFVPGEKAHCAVDAKSA